LPGGSRRGQGGLQGHAQGDLSQSGRVGAWRLDRDDHGFRARLRRALTLGKGEAVTTTEFKVNLLRPFMPDMGEVTCEANIVSRGRTIGVSEAR
jgi:hypothetical protein